MHIPQTTSTSGFREIQTNNLDELADFQINKNRSYLQLKAGELNAFYQEANLGDVQIFREKITAGSRIYAAPASQYLPFAGIFPESGDYLYCGRDRDRNRLMQASGGEWDMSFDQQLDYVCTAFNRDSLMTHHYQLTGEELPDTWLISRTNNIDKNLLFRYTYGTARVLAKIKANPALLSCEQTKRSLNAEILTFAFDALISSNGSDGKLKSYSQRVKGVYRVVDYLQDFSNAKLLPTISDLCAIAQVSERSLEYGFKELFDITPIRYLKVVRLNGVRNNLLVAAPNSRVADVAMRWGFYELGRFAKEYRNMFNELPSETLLRG